MEEGAAHGECGFDEKEKGHCQPVTPRAAASTRKTGIFQVRRLAFIRKSQKQSHRHRGTPEPHIALAMKCSKDLLSSPGLGTHGDMKWHSCLSLLNLGFAPCLNRRNWGGGEIDFCFAGIQPENQAAVSKQESLSDNPDECFCFVLSRGKHTLGTRNYSLLVHAPSKNSLSTPSIRIHLQGDLSFSSTQDRDFLVLRTQLYQSPKTQ